MRGSPLFLCPMNTSEARTIKYPSLFFHSKSSTSMCISSWGPHLLDKLCLKLFKSMCLVLKLGVYGIAFLTSVEWGRNYWEEFLGVSVTWVFGENWTYNSFEALINNTGRGYFHDWFINSSILNSKINFSYFKSQRKQRLHFLSFLFLPSNES